MHGREITLPIAIAGVIAFLGLPSQILSLERRDEVTHLRGQYNTTLFSYNTAFYHRHNEAFRIGAAIHFSHGKQHDVLLRTPFARHVREDLGFDGESVAFVNNPPRTEPTMEYYAPYTARAMWQLFLAIDWTHMHHEQTYDILSDADIPWDQKKAWTDRAVRYYLERQKAGIPRSPAPLDVTMRRAAVMMKPYFTLFRNYYPRSNNFFYAAHWWHPVIYEAMMLGGNDSEQEMMVQQTDEVFYTRVLAARPQRMLLSRESMPRYSRLSPESANIFDNLHMLHGIAYDILAYEGWTIEQKKAELYRVIEAMSYQPGDEQLARKFATPYPDLDPRVYDDWMQGAEGDMSRIMLEMWEEMMPLMMPGGMAPDMRESMMAQVRLKLAPGIQEGELPGSLMDAMKVVMPDMQMKPESMEPGASPTQMIEAMLRGWQEKHGNMPDIPPMPMDQEPSAPPLPAHRKSATLHP